ncbi:hypothetical protein J6590_077900 [Homalodisca vitripennis]|nr:hypothetical protein J6590_077900 [Homalodisca vitripennis]
MSSVQTKPGSVMPKEGRVTVLKEKVDSELDCGNLESCSSKEIQRKLVNEEDQNEPLHYFDIRKTYN